MKLLVLTLALWGSICGDILDVARAYLGVPYVAGTLESPDGEERLITCEDSLDCTTFVELSVARWLAQQSDSLTFEQWVERLRYREGMIDGYLSRLHYFTDWVAENTRRGIWHELTPEEDSPL